MKYCPFKRNVMNKDRHGYFVSNSDHNIAKIEIEFGECDETKCMAYDSQDPLNCRCVLIEKGVCKC